MSSALTETGPQPLPRRRQVQLLKALALEAGWRHLALLSGLSTLNRLLDIAGLGLAVTLLLGSGSSTDAAQVRTVIQERAQQRLMLISSHDPELLALADQVIVVEPNPASPAAAVPAQTS